jgi:hypothetical protein
LLQFIRPLANKFQPKAIPASGATDGLLSLYGERGQVAQLVEQRTENPRVGGSIPSLATILQCPTLIGWAFSFLHSAKQRGVPGCSACATDHRRQRPNAAGSTLFCSLFSQNLRQLLRQSTRTRPFHAATCTCVTAMGYPSCMDDQRIKPTQRSNSPRTASSTDLGASA